MARIVTRVGLPIPRGAMLAHAKASGYPVLVSANAFFAVGADGRGRFRLPPASAFAGIDAALDSSGYVAMARYNGYRWSANEYLDLAAAAPWTWYAAMDLASEAELASNELEVQLRLAGTVRNYLHLCRLADDRGMARPIPVVQGQSPRHYLWCADEMGLTSGSASVPLIGVGSMCRRNVAGDHGIVAIVEMLDRVLPPGTLVHLFGIKSASLMPLAGHPRVHSIDSCAWDFALRMDVRRGRSMDLRKAAIDAWYHDQQLRLHTLPGPRPFVDVDALRARPMEDETFGYADLVMDGQLDYEDARRYAWNDPEVLAAMWQRVSAQAGSAHTACGGHTN